MQTYEHGDDSASSEHFDERVKCAMNEVIISDVRRMEDGTRIAVGTGSVKELRHPGEDIRAETTNDQGYHKSRIVLLCEECDRLSLFLAGGQGGESRQMAEVVIDV